MAVQETRVRPPEFIEAAGKTFLDDLSSATGDFKAADLSQVYGAQNVAGLDPLQQRAIQELESGIGEHPQHIDEIDKQFQKIADAQEKLKAISDFREPRVAL